MKTENNEIKDAIEHLQEVLKHSEESVMTILASAKGLQENTGDKAVHNKLVTAIYDACTFQDVCAQRVRKVIKLLDSLKSGVAPAKAKAKNGEVDLLEGPQLPKNKLSQDMIDKTFAG